MNTTGLAFLISVICVVILVNALRRVRQRSDRDSAATPSGRSIRCPNCGSPAKVTGTVWECPWCGDFGNLKR